MKIITKAIVGAALLSASLGVTAQSDERMFKVEVTNLTYGQVFSPVLVVSHWRDIALFKEGEEASEPLAKLAEGGATQPLIDAIADNDRVRGTAVSDGPVLPGKTVTIMVPVNRAGKISLASMMVNTNDAFVALNTVQAPYSESRTYYALGYDAGSEKNDELCVHIPGPACADQGNEQGGVLGDPGEGYVHIHRGVHGIADLDEAANDWRNPVAKIKITMIK